MPRGDTVGLRARHEARLQVDILADNPAMVRAWIDGDFADEVVLGLVASEWATG